MLEPHGPWQGNLYPVYPFSPYYAHPPPAYGPYGYYPPHSMATPPAPTLLLPTPTLPTPTPPPHAQSTSTFSSPGTTMSHSVSLSEFCMKYHLSAQTQEKLEKLDYIPGNKVIESLLEAEWTFCSCVTFIFISPSEVLWGYLQWQSGVITQLHCVQYLFPDCEWCLLQCIGLAIAISKATWNDLIMSLCTNCSQQMM